MNLYKLLQSTSLQFCIFAPPKCQVWMTLPRLDGIATWWAQKGIHREIIEKYCIHLIADFNLSEGCFPICLRIFYNFM